MYAWTLGPFGLITRAASWIKDAALIMTNRYKPQLGNSIGPFRWSQTCENAPPMEAKNSGAMASMSPPTTVATTPTNIADVADFAATLSRD